MIEVHALTEANYEEFLDSDRIPDVAVVTAMKPEEARGIAAQLSAAATGAELVAIVIIPEEGT